MNGGSPLPPGGALWRRWLAGVHPGPSGPLVAATFQRAFALVTVAAWASLGWQIRVLIGEHGLLPLAPALAAAQRGDGEGISWFDYPSVLRLPELVSDGALLAGTGLGVLLGLLAFFRVLPRTAFLLSTLLYLSYAAACQSFLAFQWDNLLLECGLLVLFLPRDRPAPLGHLLFRVLLWKLYFQSGLAKWQSPIGDWQDGSAMSFYYETAPLPTWLGYYAHQLPAFWHRCESWLVLAGELLVPWTAFAPGRLPRRVAAGVLTLFQLVNLLTGNYGFFCYLSLALHLFLLEDRDLERALAWLRRRGRAPRPSEDAAAKSRPARPRAAAAPPARGGWLRPTAAGLALAAYLGLSLLEGLERFAPLPSSWQERLLPLTRRAGALRLVNSYHLFASVTRERIEPQLESRQGGRWTTHHLRHKPGDPRRAPNFVAPHQPRVDFLLWFHGLAWRRHPAYLMNLLDRLCHQPQAVSRLFAAALPARPEAVRVTYYRYRMTDSERRRRTGRYWERAWEGTGPEVSCDR